MDLQRLNKEITEKYHFSLLKPSSLIFDSPIILSFLPVSCAQGEFLFVSFNADQLLTPICSIGSLCMTDLSQSCQIDGFFLLGHKNTTWYILADSIENYKSWLTLFKFQATHYSSLKTCINGKYLSTSFITPSEYLTICKERSEIISLLGEELALAVSQMRESKEKCQMISKNIKSLQLEILQFQDLVNSLEERSSSSKLEPSSLRDAVAQSIQIKAHVINHENSLLIAQGQLEENILKWEHRNSGKSKIPAGFNVTAGIFGFFIWIFYKLFISIN